MSELIEIVEIIKNGARDIILPAFGKVQASIKADGSLVTQADLDMSQHIKSVLAERWPNIVFLSEEMTPEQHAALMKTSKPLWVLDPLDGTTNFASGIPVFAVSLALIENGTVKFGVVYDPVRDECFTAEKGKPAQLNGTDICKPVVPENFQQSVAVIDFKRLSLALRQKIIAEVPYRSQRNFGSGALDWCWLAIGRGHIYLHGRQNAWDYIAGQMILQQAHGQCCTLEGQAVFDGKLSASSVIAAATPELFEQWRSYLI